MSSADMIRKQGTLSRDSRWKVVARVGLRDTNTRIQVFWDVTVRRWMRVSRSFETRSVIFSGQAVWTPWPLMITTLRSSETSVTLHPTIQGHVPQDLNPQQYRCENLKFPEDNSPTYSVGDYDVICKVTDHQAMKMYGVLET
jgi:hypothetical protein